MKFTRLIPNCLCVLICQITFAAPPHPNVLFIVVDDPKPALGCYRSVRFAYSTCKGAVLAMNCSIANDFLDRGIHTPFVDGFIAKNYPGREAEMFEKLSLTQPIGRVSQPDEVATAALFLCSDEASFITGSAYPVDGGTLTPR